MRASDRFSDGKKPGRKRKRRRFKTAAITSGIRGRNARSSFRNAQKDFPTDREAYLIEIQALGVYMGKFSFIIISSLSIFVLRVAHAEPIGRGDAVSVSADDPVPDLDRWASVAFSRKTR